MRKAILTACAVLAVVLGMGFYAHNANTDNAVAVSVTPQATPTIERQATYTKPVKAAAAPRATPQATPAPVPTPTPTPEPVPEPDADDLEYLAIAIYSEGGGDAVCDTCRYRIGDVILNRVNDPRFPDTILGVLTQEGQYGRFYWTGVVWPERASSPGEAEAVQRAYDTARALLTDEQHSELYGQGYIWQAEMLQGTDNVICCGNYFGR